MREIYQTVIRPTDQCGLNPQLFHRIRARTKFWAGGSEDCLGCHPRAVSLFAETATMKVTTPGRVWIGPPRRDVWALSRYSHQGGTIDSVDVHSTYIRLRPRPKSVSREPCVLQVSWLFRGPSGGDEWDSADDERSSESRCFPASSGMKALGIHRDVPDVAVD